MVMQLQHGQSREAAVTVVKEPVVSCVHFRRKRCASMKVTLWINLRPINGGRCGVSAKHAKSRVRSSWSNKQ